MAFAVLPPQQTGLGGFVGAFQRQFEVQQKRRDDLLTALISGGFLEPILEEPTPEGQRLGTIPDTIPVVKGQGRLITGRDVEGLPGQVRQVRPKLPPTVPTPKAKKPITISGLPFRPVTPLKRKLQEQTFQINEIVLKGLRTGRKFEYIDPTTGAPVSFGTQGAIVREVVPTKSGTTSKTIFDPTKGDAANKALRNAIAKELGVTDKTKTQGKFTKGQIITKGGRNFRITGFDTDGEPLVEPVQ